MHADTHAIQPLTPKRVSLTGLLGTTDPGPQQTRTCRCIHQTETANTTSAVSVTTANRRCTITRHKSKSQHAQYSALSYATVRLYHVLRSSSPCSRVSERRRNLYTHTHTHTHTHACITESQPPSLTSVRELTSLPPRSCTDSCAAVCSYV